MRKFLAAIAIAAVATFAAGAASANGGFATYLDYLNTDAIEDHPAAFVEFDLGESFGIVGGFAANRTAEYDVNAGVKLISNDVYGQILLNENFDPSLRVGVDVDLSESLFINIGYEWMFEKVEGGIKYTAFGSGSPTLGCGIRW